MDADRCAETETDGGEGKRERTGRWPDGTLLPKLLTACGRNIFVIGVCVCLDVRLIIRLI